MTDEQTIIWLRETNAALQELVAALTDRADQMRSLLVGMERTQRLHPHVAALTRAAIEDYDNLVREA